MNKDEDKGKDDNNKAGLVAAVAAVVPTPPPAPPSGDSLVSSIGGVGRGGEGGGGTGVVWPPGLHEGEGVKGEKEGRGGSGGGEKEEDALSAGWTRLDELD